MGFDPPSEAVTTDVDASTPWFRSMRQTVVFGLVAFSLLSLTLAVTLIAASVRRDIALSEASLSALQDQLIELSTPSAEVQELTATLSETVGLANQLEAAAPTSSVNWPVVIAVIDRYDPATLTLTSLTQTDNQITLTGEAANSAIAVNYRGMLESSGLFANVIPRSLKLAAPATGTTAPAETVEFILILELGSAAP